MRHFGVEVVAPAIDQTKRENASLFLVRLNTAGGLFNGPRDLYDARANRQ